MKKTINKIKISLATVWIAIISFSSKVMGQEDEQRMAPNPEPMYGVYYPTKESLSPVPMIIAFIKVMQILLIIVVFVVGIINFTKIRKIDDKNLKKKKIRNTIIIISILVLLLILSFLIVFRLLER